MRSVGRYKLEEMIGEGAMAEIYRAHDPEIDRAIAVKVLRAEFRDSQDVVARFLDEARAAGALSHPGIVTIFDVGEADGIPYIAMELLEGGPLNDMLGDGTPLPIEESISIGRQLAEALQYAHERGIVHRDVKPSNVWIVHRTGQAKLLDFGIARRFESGRIKTEIAALRTQAGQVLGTPRYMSPEQALGHKVDWRTDFFSLGAVLYEMFTGKPAFDGEGLATIALQITQSRQPSLVDRMPGFPAGLAHIIDRLLEKDPERRYQSGREAAGALAREALRFDDGRAETRRGASYRGRLFYAASAIVAVILLIGFSTILERQTTTIRRMVETSGSSIATFVAENAALSVVDNAGLPERQQDWVPLQEFVAAAADDPIVAELSVIDASGRVRGSSVAGEGGSARHMAAPDADFAFEQPILYAGKRFGTVELRLNGDEFRAVNRDARLTLIGVGIVVFGLLVATIASLLRFLVAPMRQLRLAIDRLVGGDYDYRISHDRRDEFGALFDLTNRLAAGLQDREHSAGPGGGQADKAALDADRTLVQPSVPLRKAV